MVKDSRSGIRERVEAELAKLDTPEVRPFRFLLWSFTECPLFSHLGPSR